MVRRLIWGEDFGDSISPCSTMKPLGWRMGANDYNSREELVRVIVKARHRRWETAEINAALVDVAFDDPMNLCDCFCGGFCEDDADVYYDFADIPPIPRVTLFDAYMAKRK